MRTTSGPSPGIGRPVALNAALLKPFIDVPAARVMASPVDAQLHMVSAATHNKKARFTKKTPANFVRKECLKMARLSPFGHGLA
ncbi:MAG: hypothetical protein AAF225_01850 [Pseudomonadota bacterium]